MLQALGGGRILILAGLLLLTVPLTLAIPDSARARGEQRLQPRPSPAPTSR